MAGGDTQMKVEVSTVRQISDTFEQELSHEHGGRQRREQFVGRTREELAAMVGERRHELEKR